MAIDIEKLVSGTEHTIVIYDNTLDAEEEVTRFVDEELVASLAPLAVSGVDAKALKEKVGIAMRSIARLIAESVSAISRETQDAAHLQKEHFDYAKANLPREGFAIVDLFHEWEQSIEKYLKSQLKTATRPKEAIFDTCEKFKIDLVEFSRIFPKLP